ncbi:MAG TPA: Gfo/Idh/MocA family oxidoreductase [Arachnia sp.]|nr:Gfo/Idh/MocA family oxidoreductase [Arachnia sp.]
MRISLIGSGIIGAAHAARLDAMPRVTELLVADFVDGRAEELAGRLGKARAITVEEAFDAALDGVVVTAKTSRHAELLHRALDARLPVFCEKPIALDLATTREVVAHAARVPEVPVQIGFQRRFDAGYTRAKEAYASGRLGFVHTLRATTFDHRPPSAAYVPTSGGLFRDCSSHDFDAIRWLTGREAVSVYAVGSNRGEPYFGEHGDVDSGSCLVTYDDGMIAVVSASRNNGAGHDVRLELHGSEGGRFVGLDDRAPLVTAEEDLSWRQKPPYLVYHERFEDAYVAELAHFLDVIESLDVIEGLDIVGGVDVVGSLDGTPSTACPPAEALEALLLAEACVRSAATGAPVWLADLRAEADASGVPPQGA